MKKKYTLYLALFTLVCLTSFQLSAQTTEPAPPPASPFKVTAELVSHYVWRGSMATGSPTPNFQPTFSYTKGNFEIGAWGSTDFADSYKELDPYVSYTAGVLKFTVTDYNWNFGHANYFDYKQKETGHMFEGTIGYTGPESMPISVTLNTMFYGFDQKGNGNISGYASNTPSADSAKQAFSTYIELGYTKGPASLFLGFTPMASYYNNYGVTKWDATASRKTFSIVNLGATVTRNIKVTNDFSIPVRATLIINPAASYSRFDFVHLVFGITF